MVIPILTSVMRESFSQAPLGEREGAYALGATRWGMIRSVVLPFGKGGIIGGTMLGLGRALGETIVVILIISPVFTINFHILQTGGNSVSSLIANLVGESSSFGISALMAAGLALFALTLISTSRPRPSWPGPARAQRATADMTLLDDPDTDGHRASTPRPVAPQAPAKLGGVRRGRSSTSSGRPAAGICGRMPARAPDRPVGPGGSGPRGLLGLPRRLRRAGLARRRRAGRARRGHDRADGLVRGASPSAPSASWSSSPWPGAGPPCVHLNFYTQDMSKAGPLAPLTVGGMGHALVGHPVDDRHRRGPHRAPRAGGRRLPGRDPQPPGPLRSARWSRP